MMYFSIYLNFSLSKMDYINIFNLLTGVPDADSKMDIEDYMVATKLPLTVLGPVQVRWTKGGPYFFLPLKIGPYSFRNLKL